jgi:hypothetical protein
MEEQDCLGIDRRGNLYWDGKPIEVRYFWPTLTRWQKVGAVIVVASALIGAIGVATQGWVRMTTGRAALACHQSHVHSPNKSLCRWQFHRPQSSSASRFTADASGFFILSQSGERPER